MEVGTTSRGLERPRDQNVCTLEVLEERHKKGRPHEEIRNFPFNERDPKKVFRIGTTLGVEHEAMLMGPQGIPGCLRMGAKGYARGEPSFIGSPAVC
ncbi:hypothetical protein LIER_08454 [Lithospermum erythrorhizon]|uniref:Uncharacterized protein n=1 Tax=Lithospermum erythrorhizon TaxID=34254 RepID=A0AAV3PFZ2_LITER